MTEIKRYDVDGRFEESLEGDFVKFEDIISYLSEQDCQYNKQTNELIARHAEQLEKYQNVIGAMDDIITTPENQVKVMLYDTLLERDELKKSNNHLQFLLDSVMLE